MSEMSVLKELEEILQASGSLGSRESIPIQQQNQGELPSHDIGVLIENHTVVALSTRYCELTALPSSIDQLTGLRELDLTGNLLTGLPDSLGNLPHLQKLYLDGNQLTALSPHQPRNPPRLRESPGCPPRQSWSVNQPQRSQSRSQSLHHASRIMLAIGQPPSLKSG